MWQVKRGCSHLNLCPPSLTGYVTLLETCSIPTSGVVPQSDSSPQTIIPNNIHSSHSFIQLLNHLLLTLQALPDILTPNRPFH